MYYEKIILIVFITVPTIFEKKDENNFKKAS